MERACRVSPDVGLSGKVLQANFESLMRCALNVETRNTNLDPLGANPTEGPLQLLFPREFLVLLLGRVSSGIRRLARCCGVPNF